MSGHTDYNFRAIEPKWQRNWDSQKTFHASTPSEKPKFYLLDMFPYPSGAGLHAGHTENYAASDILGRYKRAQGFNVLHPMGWDAFGLPAEQYAIKTGTHPAVTTEKNIHHFREQIKRLGIAIDWDREVNTTDPNYYRWTQWIFLQLFKKGLAYIDERPVNWCPELGTVLANEEVIDGKSEVGGFPVERRNLRQWVLRITAYADKLIDGLDKVDWPESTKTQQKNWIGKSDGGEIVFDIENSEESITVFTTRPDTLFGATYMVIAPEHPLVATITTEAQKSEVEKYVAQAANKSDLDRTDLAKEKTGVFSGTYAINPIKNERLPIWVADYVLMGYGTGAIMAVPAHDTRDFEFATTFEIPIVKVIEDPEKPDIPLPYTGDGKLVNSGEFNGMDVEPAKKAIVAKLESEDRGKLTVNYRLRDWLFSRQRYWGEPFPVLWVDQNAYEIIKTAGGDLSDSLPEAPITYKDGDGNLLYAVPVIEAFLPLSLPKTENYKPSGDAQSPLANIPEWVEVWLDPQTGATVSRAKPKPDGNWIAATRETNTMPQWAGSCWYYLRYCDPNNPNQLIDPKIEAYWRSPDMYIGGAEHAVLHLLYARFWHIFLHEIGVVSTPEPFVRLFHQGIILGELEFTLFLNKDDKPVSYDTIEDPNNWDGITRKLDEGDVKKVKIGKKEVFTLKEDETIQVDARAFKMSKSRGNVVNPDDYIEKYGADSLRMYEMFMGPLADMKPWSSNGIEGPHRFLKKVWRLIVDREGRVQSAISEGAKEPLEIQKLLNATIEKVTQDIESLSYNTAISQLMILTNRLQKEDQIAADTVKILVQLLAPFAPHMAEELWEMLGESPSVTFAPWPTPKKIASGEELFKVIFQVNGKLRGEGMFSRSAEQETVLASAKGVERVANQIEGKKIVKVIYVPGKILNIVAK
jgi:leucyl-tRNA synthetase